jgi:hypothetical protein
MALHMEETGAVSAPITSPRGITINSGDVAQLLCRPLSILPRSVAGLAPYHRHFDSQEAFRLGIEGTSFHPVLVDISHIALVFRFSSAVCFLEILLLNWG